MNHTPAPASSAPAPDDSEPIIAAGEAGLSTRAASPLQPDAPEEMLRRSHQFWQATLDTLEIGLAILDRQGRVLACNQAWREQSWSGHTCDLGRAFSSLADAPRASVSGQSSARSDAESSLGQSIRAVLAGEVPDFHGEFECGDADGPPRFYAVRVSRLDVPAALLSQFRASAALDLQANAQAASTCSAMNAAGSALEHVMVSCEEITSRRQAQDEREALARRQAAEQAAREQEQRSRERSDFLARAAEVLVSSLDLETTFAQAASLCVPFLADWCFIDLVEGEAFRRVAIAYSQVEGGEPLPPEELERRRQISTSYRRLFSIHGNVRCGAGHVIQSGQSGLYTNVNDKSVQGAAFDDGHLELLRALRMHSAMCVPLSTRGRTLGSLSFVRSLPHSAGTPQSPSFSQDDLKLVEDVARVAALAVDNARLFGQAEAANRAKDDFLAVLSHELRTPLTPILGWVYLLREEKPEEDIYQRALDIIESNARAQSRLIEDLIDVSRVVTGKLSLEKRAISLSRLARDLADAVHPQAKAKELSLSLHAPEIGMVLGDEGRLRQAMSNLVGNAIKFTPPGGRIEMRVEAAMGAAGQDLARFEVRDSGRGIEAQFLPRLFERFEQSDASSSRGQGGLGLGLTIVRHIARLHGGEVHASSLGLGQGSAFTMELPLLPANNSLGGRGRQSAQPLDIEGASILIVDDEPDARELLETLLTRAGAKVRAASSAEEAWQVFGEWRPDIVIFDLAMPDEDGCSLMRRVRALPASQGGHVAALAITAHARVEDKQRALECGFHGHVAKPIDPANLALALLELLSVART